MVCLVPVLYRGTTSARTAGPCDLVSLRNLSGERPGLLRPGYVSVAVPPQVEVRGSPRSPLRRARLPRRPRSLCENAVSAVWLSGTVAVPQRASVWPQRRGGLVALAYRTVLPSLCPFISARTEPNLELSLVRTRPGETPTGIVFTSHGIASLRARKASR